MQSIIGPAVDKVADFLSEKISEKNLLIYIGRFCPMHFGHQAIIGGVAKAAPNNHIIFVGSSNAPVTFRNLFSFTDRVDFIKAVYPQIRISGLPDFPGNNDAWFRSLDLSIALTGALKEDVVFVGGCQEDVEWFREAGRNTIVVNRFTGMTVNVSGTEIRDALITEDHMRLCGRIDSRILDQIIAKFQTQWELLRKQ